MREKYWINLYQTSRPFSRGQLLSFLCGPNKKCPEPINYWEFNNEGTPKMKLEANPQLKKANQIAMKASIPKKYINQSEKQIQDWGTFQKAISDI